jgi:hypothetical protein
MMKNLVMQRTKTILTIIFFAVLLVGCSTSNIKTDTDKLRKSHDIKMVSVLAFTCPDPVIANNVRNTIIESLLTHYSVVIGDKADVIIKGSISLANDQVSTASSVPSVDYVSEIRAQIIKNNKVMDSVIVSQASTYSPNPYSSEVMGRKIGEKIKKILSNINN